MGDNVKVDKAKVLQLPRMLLMRLWQAAQAHGGTVPPEELVFQGGSEKFFEALDTRKPRWMEVEWMAVSA